MTDALKNTTTYDYDNLGHLTRTTYADGSYIDTHYDIYNNKSAVSVQHKDGEDPRWTNYAHDYAGRLTDVYLAAVVDPQNGNVQTRPHTQYGYDTFGNELMQTDALQRVTTFHYDGYGRQDQRTLPAVNGQPTATEYTIKGDLLLKTGNTLSEGLVERLDSYARRDLLPETILAEIAQSGPPSDTGPKRSR